MDERGPDTSNEKPLQAVPPLEQTPNEALTESDQTIPSGKVEEPPVGPANLRIVPTPPEPVGPPPADSSESMPTSPSEDPAAEAAKRVITAPPGFVENKKPTDDQPRPLKFGETVSYPPRKLPDNAEGKTPKELLEHGVNNVSPGTYNTPPSEIEKAIADKAASATEVPDSGPDKTPPAA